MAAGVLEYQLRADVADFQSKLQQVNRTLQQSAQAAQQVGSRVQSDLGKAADAAKRFSDQASLAKSALAGFAGGFVAGAVAQAFTELVKAAQDYAKELTHIGEVSKRTGVSVRDLSGTLSVASRAGISTKQALDDINSLGAAVNKEFREGEGAITRLMKDNNISLTDRNGKLKDTNRLLEDAASLIKNAKTEFDKIEIAKIFNLSEDWVKELEKGPEALRQARDEAKTLGGALDEELVRKAQQFEDNWRTGWANFVEFAKSAIVQAEGMLQRLVEKSKSWYPNTPDNVVPGYTTLFDTEGGNELVIHKPSPGAVPPMHPRSLPSTYASPTVLNTGKEPRGGGGGSSGPDIDAIQRYIIALQRANETVAAELATWGKSNLERETAINLVKIKATAERAGLTVTDEQREKVKAITAAYVKQQEELEKLRQQQQDLKELASTFADAITGWVVDGRKFRDVLKDILKSLEQMLLKAALMGEGPLAGLLNLRGTGGNAGGLLGGLFGLFNKGPAIGPGISGLFAGGGNVSRGRAYVVGEKGPELFLPNASGAIMTGSAGGGGHTFQFNYSINGDNVSKAELMAAMKMVEGRTVSNVREAIARGKL